MESLQKNMAELPGLCYNCRMEKKVYTTDKLNTASREDLVGIVLSLQGKKTGRQIIRKSSSKGSREYASQTDIRRTIPLRITETAKANRLKVYEYVEHLLTEIPKHMDDTDLSFLDDLLPWSANLPERCRKSNKYEVK